jgi:small subunit ribosomal protein S19
MSRSSWKGPYIEKSLLKRALAAAGSHKIINTWSRKSTIIPDFVGLTFGVYNGKTFVPVVIKEEMVGKKLGEFSPTRTFKGHTPADKKASPAAA